MRDCSLFRRLLLPESTVPRYEAKKNTKAGQTLVIDKSTKDIRPHCVTAVLRNVKFTKERY